MSGRRTYLRQLEAIAKAAGGELARGGGHWRIVLPNNRVVPAACSPGKLKGAWPRRVELMVANALAAGAQ